VLLVLVLVLVVVVLLVKHSEVLYNVLGV